MCIRDRAAAESFFSYCSSSCVLPQALRSDTRTQAGKNKKPCAHRDVYKRQVGRTYGISPEDIEGPMRTTPISNARKVAIYVVREITQLPLQEIGAKFNNRDHSTIVYALKDVEKNMKKESFQLISITYL